MERARLAASAHSRRRRSVQLPQTRRRTDKIFLVGMMAGVAGLGIAGTGLVEWALEGDNWGLKCEFRSPKKPQLNGDRYGT